MSEALKKNSKSVIERVLSKQRAMRSDPVIGADASELIRHTAESIFATRHFVRQSLDDDKTAEAARPTTATAAASGSSPDAAGGAAVAVSQRPAPAATDPGQIADVMRAQLIKILKKSLADGSEAGGASGRWLGQSVSEDGFALVVCAAAVFLDDEALPVASVPPRVAAETFADMWADVRAPGVHLPAWVVKVLELLRIAGIAVEALPDQAMPPPPSADRQQQQQQQESPAREKRTLDDRVAQPMRLQPQPQVAPSAPQDPMAPLNRQFQHQHEHHHVQQQHSPPPQAFAPPVRPLLTGPFANPVPSVCALDASGALGCRITPDTFGFAAPTIDAMGIHLGATDRRHLLFTLYRLRTGDDINAAAAKFNISASDLPHIGFPAKVLFHADLKTRLSESIPPTLPEPLVEQQYPDLGAAWNVARRLVATVPVMGGSFFVALLLRLDGLVIVTSRSPRDREHDSCHNLRDGVGAPPAIPHEPSTVPHYVGPAALKGAAQMLTPNVDQSDHAQAQAEIISRILTPAAECRRFCDGFRLIQTPRGRGMERIDAVGLINLICLGWNIQRATVMHQQTVLAPAPPSDRNENGTGSHHHHHHHHHHHQLSKATDDSWPPHLLALANAATVPQQIEAVQKSKRCAFCGNVHQGSAQRRTRCEMFEHHPLYDAQRHFAVAYLVAKGHLEPSTVRRG